MANPLRIGLAGLGNVGTGVVKMLQAHGDEIAKRAGRAITIAAISAKDKSKKRNVDVSSYKWVNNPLELGVMDGIDVVVEMIGGNGGAAKDLVETAIRNGKHVVTANKALLASQGFELAQLAEDHGVSLNYEAAVAGGIPIIKTLREGVAGNRIDSVCGILNGTCNYILSEMRTTKRDFAAVLAEAQAKGYAEAEPSFDIDGIDTGHKLSILTALAFGVKPAFAGMDISGIRHITAKDIDFADELGYRIKLLGAARRVGDKIAQNVEACLVPKESAIGSVEGVFNAVYVEGDFVGKSVLEGRGAGEGPTASAVLSDLVDLARGTHLPVFGLPVGSLQGLKQAGDEDIVNEQYLHLVMLDKPGVIADVSAILRDFDISIESMLQRGRDPGAPVSVVITTHECSRKAVKGAMAKIGGLPTVAAKPTVLRIEQF